MKTKIKYIKRRKLKKTKKMKGGNREAVLASVSQNGNLLKSAGEFKDDKEIVLAAVSNTWSSLQYASPRLKADKEVVLVAIAQNENALQFASLDLRENEELATKVVSTNGLTLEHVADKLKDNENVVITAVSNNGIALKYASLNLRKNKHIVSLAVSKNGFALRFASEELKDDDELVRTAITQEGEALFFASNRLKQNRELIDIARRTFDEAYTFAEWGKPPQLFRQQSSTFTNQNPQGVCGRHVFPRVIIKNIFELLYPLPVNKNYNVNNCNKYLATGKTIADLNNLSKEECSQGGYIKILLFLHLFYLYQEHVPTIQPNPSGWLECNQVTDIYPRLYDRPNIPNLTKQMHIFMLTNVLHDIKKKVDDLQIKLITFQLKVDAPLPGHNEALFEIIQKITREGLYLMIRVERRDDAKVKNDHWSHFMLVTGTSDDKILLKNSWGTQLIFEVSINEMLVVEAHMWNFITDFSCVIPVRGGVNMDDADVSRLDETLSRFRELKADIA